MKYFLFVCLFVCLFWLMKTMNAWRYRRCEHQVTWLRTCFGNKWLNKLKFLSTTAEKCIKLLFSLLILRWFIYNWCWISYYELNIYTPFSGPPKKTINKSWRNVKCPSLPCRHPYSSTRIDTVPLLATGWKRMYLAVIGGLRSR